MPEDDSEHTEESSSDSSRVQGYIEFFSIFEEHQGLRPHHNVDIRSLFTQPGVSESGEIIYYYGDVGSFRMRYGRDMYDNDFLVRGELGVNPELAQLVSESDLESLTPASDHIMFDSYLIPEFGDGSKTKSIRRIEVPSYFSKDEAAGTVAEAKSILDQFSNFVARSVMYIQEEKTIKEDVSEDQLI